MPSLVSISDAGPSRVGIWGFHDPISVTHVAQAIKHIAGTLKGTGHRIHIMSGTHGYCKGKVGAVATRDERFANEDRALVNPVTSDNKPVVLVVHDFNNNVPPGPDPVTAAMSKLNGDLRALFPEGKEASNTILLAYCCSAGTR